MTASKNNRRGRAVLIVAACILAICLVAGGTLYTLVSRNIKALQRGAAFDLSYTVSPQSGSSPALYAILKQVDATSGDVDGMYSPGQLALWLSSSSKQAITTIYIDSEETFFNAQQVYTALRKSVTSSYPLVGAFLPEWSLPSYISQTQLASILGVPSTQVEMQDMAGTSLTLTRQSILHPAYAKDGYTYFQLPVEGGDAPSIVLGLPLKSLLSGSSIPVDIHVEIPAHNVTVTLSGTVTPALNSIYMPTADLIADSDIETIVQLRKSLEKFAGVLKAALQ